MKRKISILIGFLFFNFSLDVSEKEESKLEDLIVKSDVHHNSDRSNEFETCPATLNEAKKRNHKLIDV